MWLQKSVRVWRRGEFSDLIQMKNSSSPVWNPLVWRLNRLNLISVPWKFFTLPESWDWWFRRESRCSCICIWNDAFGRLLKNQPNANAPFNSLPYLTPTPAGTYGNWVLPWLFFEKIPCPRSGFPQFPNPKTFPISLQSAGMRCKELNGA